MAGAHPAARESRSALRELPDAGRTQTTRLGSWAVRLAAAGVVLVLAWRVVPRGAALGFAFGLVGGVVALVAIFRRGERAITVFAAIVPSLLVLGFVLAELTGGHD